MQNNNAENLLLKKYKQLIDNIVKSFSLHSNHSIDKDDIKQIAQITLIECFRKNNNIDDYQFLNYASTRMKGAVIDEFRKLDWNKRKSRDDFFKIDEFLYKTEMCNKKVSEERICKELKISKNDLRDFYLSKQSRFIESVEDLAESGEILPSEKDELNIFFDKEFILKEICNLPSRLQIILSLHYFHSISFGEIAQSLGIDERQLRRSHQEAILKLKKMLADNI